MSKKACTDCKLNNIAADTLIKAWLLKKVEINDKTYEETLE